MKDRLSQQMLMTMFFLPRQPQESKQYDIGYDVGLNVRYATEVDCSCGTMQDREYERLIQSLNLEQSEMCICIMEWIQTKSEPLHTFIEGGAGVGKTHVEKQYISQWKGFMVLSLVKILIRLIVLY